MSIQFTLCGSLFEKLNITGNLFRSKKNNKEKVKLVIEDINLILASNNNNKKYICNHILNKIVQITNSEYGFIGKVIPNNNGSIALQTYAITNIAWNASSHQFFLDHLSHGLRFTNMDTLFGEVISQNRSMIFNKYDKKRMVLPDGHPLVRRFMGVVSNTSLDNHPIVMVGVCNKVDNYHKQDVKNVQKILDLLAYLFINFDNFNQIKNDMTDDNMALQKEHHDTQLTCMKDV